MAAAQPSLLVHHHWNLVEVHAGTNSPVPSPNGVVEPGEGLRFELSISFDPPVGSLVNWSGPPEPGSGTIAALSAIAFSLEPSAAPAQGAWTHLSQIAGWLGTPGVSTPHGAVSGIFIGQLASGALNQGNPIENIWAGVWTPASYEPRIVEWYRFQTGPLPNVHGAILAQYGTDPTTGQPLYTALHAFTPFYFLPVAIVPSPASGSLVALVFAGALLRRRR
jgi:hypothetical protein